MSESEVNIPLLRKAVEWVEAEAAKSDPRDCRWIQQWWQTDVSCGTAYCVAGYVAQLVDGRYAHQEYVDDVHLSVAAAEALGLDFDRDVTVAYPELFRSHNTAEDVRRIAEEIAGEPL